MDRRVAILNSARSPFCKSGGLLQKLPADDLAAMIVTELLARSDLRAEQVDEVIFGNVAQPAHAANIARVICLKAGFPDTTVAHTVHHNCASGMRAITAGALQLLSGDADLIVAGGTESMSRIPLLFNDQMTALFQRLHKARTTKSRLKALAAFRPAHLRPEIALQHGLTDPICGLNVGQTAEILAREFSITRQEQDAFALESHRKACDAREHGRLRSEIAPLIAPPSYADVIDTDDGPRENQTLEALAKLKPCFDRYAGTVTAGNTCPITDGAAAVLLSTEAKARALGITPIGYLNDWAYAALDTRRMGLGPVFATAKLCRKTGMSMDDFDLIELNEAFAAQVIANERAFASRSFAREHLETDHALGEIDRARLNVNGGALALGHPVGTTGTRLVSTLLGELSRRGLERGLATLCVGGGQGAALSLEAA